MKSKDEGGDVNIAAAVLTSEVHYDMNDQIRWHLIFMVDSFYSSKKSMAKSF